MRADSRWKDSWKSTSLWGRELKCNQAMNCGMLSLVDLLVRSWVEIYECVKYITGHSRRPPCEVVSWNLCRMHTRAFLYSSRPPCEVVSWNTKDIDKFVEQDLVDLLVRSWVEIWNWWIAHILSEVDLLVRSWVEIKFFHAQYSPVKSTSLWGRELK